MKLRAPLIVVIFIIILTVVILIPDVTTAVLIISLLANFVLITMQLCLVHEPHLPAPTKHETAESSDEEDPIPPEWREPYNEAPEYDEWRNYNSYNDSAVYQPKALPPEITDNDATGDLRAVESVRNRTRDKRALESSVRKTVDYYRYHFGNELDEHEKKVWWQKDWDAIEDKKTY